MEIKDKYIKTDKDVILNETCILWVKKIDECLHVCMRSNGCTSGVDTHEICKVNNLKSYTKLNQFFNNS